MKNHTHTHHIILPKWLWNRNYDTADINGLEPALCVSHVWTPSLWCFPSCWDKIRISRGVWPCYFICGGWRFAVHQNSDMFKVKVLTFQRVSDTPKKLTSQLRVCYGKSPMIYLQKLRVFFPWPTLRLPKGIPSYLRSRDMRRKRWRISDIVSTSGDLTGCGDDLDISAVKTQPVVFTKRYERSASLQLKISGDDVHTRNDQRNKQCSRQFMFIPNGKTHSVFI